MARLGYDRYGAQGGDWGSMVTTTHRRSSDPEHVAGIHLNMPIVVARRVDRATTDAERAGARSTSLEHYHDAGASGYSTQQSTRPQTLGYGLVDSPAGQCAWIVEKFWAWTDCDGHPENVAHPRRAARQRDALLAARHRRVVGPALLGELQRRRPLEPGRRCRSGVLDLPEGDLPRRRGAGPSAASPTSATGTSSTRGGHFAAFEQPELFVDEVRAFFRLMR